MFRTLRLVGPLALLAAAVAAPAYTQTPYHLHTEASLVHGGVKQLKTAGPDTAAVVLQSPNLKNQNAQPADFPIGYFETQSNVPNLAGFIPANSVATFSLVMRKTASYGTFRPRAILFLNNYCCSDGVFVCETAGPNDTPPGPALTTTFTRYTLQCTNPNAIVMGVTDRFFASVVVNVTATPGNHNIYCELEIEGTSNPSATDSYVTIPNVAPLPTITSLSPTSGPINWVVTINGSHFGSTPGSVTFYNNKPATITNWTDGSITARVPAGATNGVVTVTASGVNATCPGSNCTFTVLPAPSLTSLTPSTAHWTDAVTIAGANFMDQRGDSTVTFFNGVPASPSAWSNLSITVPVPVGAASGNVVVTVSSQPSNGLAFTAIPPPTVTSATPASAHRDDPVTIAGTNFGASQGVNTIKFNGTTATATNWSDLSIVATVPTTATTGNIVVAVSNQASNGLPFTVVIPGTMTGTITRATGGTGIGGASVQAVQTGIVKGSAMTAADGSYTIASLDPASYDVRVFASGFSPELRTALTVTSETTTTVNVSMYVPGSVSGRVTQADGVTPLSGAAVTVHSGPSQKGSTSTNGTGDYTIGSLHPGAYTVQAADVGYSTSEQGASVAENATTTRNFSLQGAPSGPVLYAYDALGRLVQVTNPEGESAIYRYDPVGNITAIERPAGTGTVAISGFTPNVGPVGTPVTISGTGFSPTPASNQVTFGGTPATVTSATATQLIVTAPAGGQIAITAPGGSANTGSSAFTVPTAGPPTITSFTPGTAASGTALTVNGTNFETVAGNDNLRVNISPVQVSSATATALQSAVPPSATTGRVSVATPNGTAVSANYLWVAPPPYLVADLDTTGTLPFGGSGTSVSVAANKVALRVFDGTEGHRASVNVTGVTGGNVSVNVYDPFGTVLTGALVVSDSGFVDTADLRSTATYSIVVDPSSPNPTAGTLTLYDVPPDFTSPVAFGSAVTVQTTVPGQNGRLTFTGTVGQRVSVNQTGGYNCFTATTSILAPDGSPVGASTCGGTFMDTRSLTVAGTHAILVDPIGANYGSTTVTVYDVPADFMGTIPFNMPTPVTTTVPGQNGLVTFSGTVNQRIALNQVGYNCFSSTTTIKKPPDQNGGTLVSTCGGTFIDTQTLNDAGTYTIVVDPKDASYGSTTLTLYDVPADASGSTTVGGPSVTLPMNAIGQNGFVTFPITQSQQVTIHVTGNTVNGYLYLRLLDPNGLELANTLTFTDHLDWTPPALSAPGTYKVVLDPGGMATGSATVSITTP